MIREMKDTDLRQVLEIEQQLFSPPWDEAQFCYELHDNPFAYLYVMEENGTICAYMDYWITFEKAQLANIAVKQAVQRQGYAQHMMDAMIETCEKAFCEHITLEVRVDNNAAIALYERNGFIRAAIRKGYYEDGTDAYLMVKPLGGAYV